MHMLDVVTLSFAAITCEDNQVYAKLIKKTKAWGNEEKITIMDGTESIYESPTFANQDERTIEVCIQASTNNQYTIVFTDSGNDSWSDGAWIKIEGVNGNIVYKAFMIANSEESHPLSLYSPINKSAVWKYSSTAGSSWKDYNYSDSDWAEVTLGSTGQQATGTQYFRKQFAGLTNMAAIDIQLKYRYGVVAYINGVEVFRDNMPNTEITGEVLAISGYGSADYRGVIRPSKVAEDSLSVLAVEIHFMEVSHSETITFDAFLSFFAPVDSDSSCYVVPLDTTVTGNGFTNPENAVGWDYGSGTSATVSGSDFTVEFNSLSLPMIGSFRIWPYTSASDTVSTFQISGGTSLTSSWTAMMISEDNTYQSKEWKQFDRVAPAERYQYVRFTAMKSQSGSMKLFELQFLVCNIPLKTVISFEESSYQYYKDREQVNIVPTEFGFNGCSTSPTLPTGISIDPATCIISGIGTVTQAMTSYTVTATMSDGTATGTISIGINECTGTVYKLVRSYRIQPQSEAFRIRNTANDDILYEVAVGHSHPAKQDWIHYICITVDRFDITVYGEGTVWSSSSFLYLYALLPDNEEEMLVKMRFDEVQGNDHEYFLRRYSIDHSQQWYYKMGDLPANWYNSETSNWEQAARGTFPESDNQIQLYKKSFSISALSEVAGLVLSLRYKYGCVVYLNGHEAWRNGVNGELTTSSTAENAYQDLKYHIVTLPGRSVITSSSETPIYYLQQGTNTIAIALLAISNSQKTSYFDAMVRLVTTHSHAHIWEFTATTTGISGAGSNAFDMDYTSILKNDYTAGPNTLIVTLNNDRREWVSSVQIQNYYYSNSANPVQFVLYGRNGEDDWTLLKNVTGLTYSMGGQKRRIYFNNNIPYNQFKFENFATDNQVDRTWRLQSLNLYGDDVMTEMEPLVYDSTISVYRGIEMAEVIPQGTGYSDFVITPQLPDGLCLDTQTGWISGTPTTLTPPTVHTITANKVAGGSTQVTITLSVIECKGDVGLMTVRIRADNFLSENQWKLFSNRDTTGTPLKSVSKFPVSNTYYYNDFCMQSGIYTFVAIDTYGDGWTGHTGYTLTVDLGEMELDIGELPSSSTKPVTVSTVFSTYFPFQIEYTDWKVYQSIDEVSSGWNTVSFDDSTWSTMKASELGATDAITTYIRKSFSISGVSDYQVMNVRVKYAGGVAAYLNGNLVARFNLAEDFDSNTESITIHDSTLFSKFHVILATAGIQEGTNVFAFEIHRPIGTSSSESVVFDATGVFGVEDCSTVVDTFSTLESSDLSGDALNVVMDLDPYTSNELSNTVGSYIEWTVENLVGSKWNSFNILGSPAAASWGFMINARLNSEDTDTIPILDVFNQTITDRVKPQLSAPVGLAGFRQFRWEVYTAADASMIIDSIHMAYCKASGSVCPGEGNYPSVGEGQISPSTCPDGYRGYLYRECSGGVLGEVKTDHCTQKPPTNPRYRQSRFVFVMGTEVSSGVPSVRNIVEKWSVDSDVILPAGLSLNAQTGEISGTPSSVQDLITYTIYAENQSGASKTEVSIQVRKGTCKAEGVFPVTEVGSVAVYECSSQGNYIGTQKCSCVLGAEDGVWESASGFCMSVVTLVILILVVIIIIAVIVVILIRVSKKKRVVGGVKGKKVAKKAPKSTPKKNAKV